MRIPSPVLTALAALAFTAHALTAQAPCTPGETTLAAGDPRLASFVPAAEEVSDVWMERDTARRTVGTFTQTVTRTRHGGAPALLVVQRMESPRGTMVDSIVVAAGTFAPLRHAASTPQHVVSVDYAGGRVRGTVTEQGTARPVDAALGDGVFDYSVASMVLHALPLCEGRVIRVSGYDATRGPVSATARVVGAETVEIRGRSFDVWTLEMDFGTGRPTRQYVDRATGREVGWRVDMPGGAVMRGATRL